MNTNLMNHNRGTKSISETKEKEKKSRKDKEKTKKDEKSSSKEESGPTKSKSSNSLRHTKEYTFERVDKNEKSTGKFPAFLTSRLHIIYCFLVFIFCLSFCFFGCLLLSFFIDLFICFFMFSLVVML
jgi:hypothetical protein